jgi:hypothetical protein
MVTQTAAEVSFMPNGLVTIAAPRMGPACSIFASIGDESVSVLPEPHKPAINERAAGGFRKTQADDVEHRVRRMCGHWAVVEVDVVKLLKQANHRFPI